MFKQLLIWLGVAALMLMSFETGRASVDAGAPSAHVDWLEAAGSIGALSNSPERENALMSAAEERIDCYVGVAIPLYYIEWRGWVFVVVSVQPVAQAPFVEYRILAYREVESEWLLFDEWRWATDVRY